VSLPAEGDGAFEATAILAKEMNPPMGAKLFGMAMAD